jgi:hypothetical protein
MSRMWRAARLLAFGGLAFALGCRAHPNVPVCTTPLLPEVVADGPSNLPAPTIAARPTVPKVPDPPAGGVDAAPVVPPKDVVTAISAEPLAAVKPVVVEARKPAVGDDGFGPGPRVPIGSPEPVVVVPAVARRAPPPATPLKPGERIGHAPDYRWLVGVADWHGRGGYWTVRFADIGADDPWGGKVRLLDDDRLRDLGNGDVVYVTGEILAPASAAESAPACPPYRVKSVSVVDKAN